MPPSRQPAQRANPGAREAHQLRAVAESFGTDAARYDRTRLCYPAALISRIIAASPGRDLLDVGAGTGIAARQFQEAGCTVLGVEPDERMAAFARDAGTASEVATFENWDPDGRLFDAVVAGTAWHWVDPVAGAAKAATVLRPGGLLAPFWNVADPPPEVAEALAVAFRRAVPDSPFRLPGPDTKMIDAYQAILSKTADGIRQAGGYAEPEQWRYDWEQHYTRDEWLDYMPTGGGLTRVPPDVRAPVLAAVGAAIDAMGGEMTVQVATVAVAAVRDAG